MFVDVCCLWCAMCSCCALIDVAVVRCGYLLVFFVCGALLFVVVGCLWLRFVGVCLLCVL